MSVRGAVIKEFLEPNEQTILNHKWQVNMSTKNLWAKLVLKEN